MITTIKKVTGSFYYAPLHRRWNGGILDSPRYLSVRLSVRPSVPSVDKVSGTFEKSLLTPIHFRVPSPIFGPLVGKNLAEMGFPELSEKKTIGLIHFILGIYYYGVGLLTLYISTFLASFLALWWPNISWKWGFQNFFKRLLVPFITYLAFNLRGWVSWPLFIFVFLASFSALWWPNIWPKWGFWNSLKKLWPQFISYLAFLDEVGSDQSGGIWSPSMGTAC